MSSGNFQTDIASGKIKYRVYIFICSQRLRLLTKRLNSLPKGVLLARNPKNILTMDENRG